MAHLEKNPYWEDAYTTGDYKQRWQYNRATQEVVTAVVCGAIAEKARVLDLGCGAGEDAMYLASLGRSVSGIDWAETAIAIARAEAKRRGLTVDWQVGSVLAMPFADNTFDFAVDRGCLHHIPNEHRAQYAKELRRVLKPGGKALIRGCRQPVDYGNFVLLNEEVMQTYFKPEGFTWTPLQPIQLVSEADRELGLPAWITLVTKGR